MSIEYYISVDGEVHFKDTSTGWHGPLDHQETAQLLSGLQAKADASDKYLVTIGNYDDQIYDERKTVIRLTGKLETAEARVAELEDIIRLAAYWLPETEDSKNTRDVLRNELHSIATNLKK